MMRILRSHVKIGVIFIFSVLLIVLTVPIIMRYTVKPYTFISLEDVPNTEVAIILGASVVDKRPSQILANRADIAIQLYFKHKVSKILVTGDSAKTSHDEVTPVRKYLVNAGIPPKDIFLDHAGFDTYSSIRRAINIFGASSATIVTQDFHLPRALYIARHLGLETYGVVANGQGGLSGYMREIPASIKALLELYFYNMPKYIDPVIPLISDGQATWN